MAGVLYIVQLGNVEPWLADFRETAKGRIEFTLLDHDAPLEPQFRGITVVVDQGGHATRDMIDIGAEAPDTDGLHAGIDYLRLPVRSLPPLADLPEMGRRLKRWYGRHCLALQADELLARAAGPVLA